jgi:hypothetical protein
MKTKFSKIRVISHTRKTKVLNCQYRIGKSLIFLRDSITSLDVHTDCKRKFRHHVDFIFPRAIKLLGLIRKITSSLSTQDVCWCWCCVSLWSVLCFSMPVAWKFLTTANSNELEHIQGIFAEICCNIQNYWGFRLCLESGILETRKHNVSETVSVQWLR